VSFGDDHLQFYLLDTVTTKANSTGNSGVASHNEVTNSGQAAILIEGDDNSVQGNELTEAPVGILKLSGTVGNTHSGNSFFATLITVQDPAPVQQSQRGA
jgi:hypothetical protein